MKSPRKARRIHVLSVDPMSGLSSPMEFVKLLGAKGQCLAEVREVQSALDEATA